MPATCTTSCVSLAATVSACALGRPGDGRGACLGTTAPVSVAAVVVAWRAGERAGACLRRLEAVAPSAPRVLVDNEAGDGSGVDAPDGTTIVRLSDNRGFAGGANAGLALAFADGAEHAVVLNDDVLVEAGCVETLAAAAGADGAASPRIDGPPGFAFAGGELEPKRGFGRHVEGAADYLSGACLCLSRAAWETVGQFDAGLFLYYEDVDWCLRARELGVPLTVALDAHAAHSGGASSGGEDGETWAYYSTRNRLWLLEQRRGARTARLEAMRTSLRARLRTAQPARRAVARAKLVGVRDWSERRMGRGPWPR
jgi:GT2 family glycosyltransferase